MRINRVIKNYFLVTKPGIVCGNMISAAGGFFLASRGRIVASVFLSAIIGISMVVASGCVFNNYIDRDIDRQMARTRDRVLARGLISPRAALFHGLFLGLAGAMMLWVGTNMLAVTIVLMGFTVYVGAYSLYLKRNSVYGACIGSLAGAAPPLAAYCAVSNHFDLGAVILLSIFCLWQIPHSYAIAVFRLDDYATAALPVLPVMRNTPAARMRIVCYIPAFMAATFMLTLCGYTGYSTFWVGATLGVFWWGLAWQGSRTSDERLWAKRLFIFSIVNISILSAMMSIDFRTPGK